jgi:hypothetical protein
MALSHPPRGFPITSNGFCVSLALKSARLYTDFCMRGFVIAPSMVSVCEVPSVMPSTTANIMASTSTAYQAPLIYIYAKNNINASK